MPTSRRRWRSPVAAAIWLRADADASRSIYFGSGSEALTTHRPATLAEQQQRQTAAAVAEAGSGSSRGSRHSPSSLFVGSSLARIAPLSFCFVAVAVLVVILLHSSFRFKFFWLCVRLHQFALHFTVSCKCFIRFKEVSSAYLQNCVG